MGIYTARSNMQKEKKKKRKETVEIKMSKGVMKRSE
jgi:hypothetical protein